MYLKHIALIDDWQDKHILTLVPSQLVNLTSNYVVKDCSQDSGNTQNLVHTQVTGTLEVHVTVK